MKAWVLAACGMLAMGSAASATAQRVGIDHGSVVETVARLEPGQYVWEPQIAPAGPMLLVVNLVTQRAILFRNGVPIAASTASTGRPGRSTPTGVFEILQKHIEHYSSKYNNAPMPYMQRLTWAGVALHAGNLPGYPASHGCIRLPAGFAKLLYQVTSIGMTVVITDRPAIPRVAPAPSMLVAGTLPVSSTAMSWEPEKSPAGPVSILVSAKDGRAVVLRNGIVIGSAPVTVDGPVTGTWAYSLASTDSSGQHWLKLPLSGETEPTSEVPGEEWQRFHAPDQFKRAVASIVQPGTTIVVTSDALQPGQGSDRLVVMEGAASPPPK